MVTETMKDVAHYMEHGQQHTLLYEDMIRAETDDMVCRIWRVRTFDGMPLVITNEGLKCLAVHMMDETDLSLEAIVTRLVKIEHVNSVEIIDRESGDGICVHKDWP